MVTVIIIQKISSNHRRVVRSAVAHEFDTVRNMTLHYYFMQDILLKNFSQGKKYWDISATGYNNSQNIWD